MDTKLILALADRFDRAEALADALEACLDVLHASNRSKKKEADQARGALHAWGRTAKPGRKPYGPTP